MPYGFTKWEWEQLNAVQQRFYRDENYLCAPDYFEILPGTWKIYAYGDSFKVTYCKTGAKGKKRDINEIYGQSGHDTKKPTVPNGDKESRLAQSVSRTRKTIFELAICNEFQHFCTFTQSAEKVKDRFDLETFRADLAQYVRNQNRGRDVKIQYLLIPEQHKDGAWHMHGLFSGLTDKELRPFSLDEKLPYRIRKQISNGETVYNWDKVAKKYGYFTATEIKSHAACSKYITKYITKDLLENNLDAGRHSFFASKGLKRRECIARGVGDDCPIIEWGFENDYYKVAWFDSGAELGAAMQASLQNQESVKGVI